MEHVHRSVTYAWRSSPELSQTLASLDAFRHTGADETFCQMIQEALASGVPVVTPAAGGPMGLVRHGDNGWLFPDDDPAMLCGAVTELGSWSSTLEAILAAHHLPGAPLEAVR